MQANCSNQTNRRITAILYDTRGYVIKSFDWGYYNNAWDVDFSKEIDFNFTVVGEVMRWMTNAR